MKHTCRPTPQIRLRHIVQRTVALYLVPTYVKPRGVFHIAQKMKVKIYTSSTKDLHAFNVYFTKQYRITLLWYVVAHNLIIHFYVQIIVKYQVVLALISSFRFSTPFTTKATIPYNYTSVYKLVHLHVYTYHLL